MPFVIENAGILRLTLPRKRGNGGAQDDKFTNLKNDSNPTDMKELQLRSLLPEA